MINVLELLERLPDKGFELSLVQAELQNGEHINDLAFDLHIAATSINKKLPPTNTIGDLKTCRRNPSQPTANFKKANNAFLKPDKSNGSKPVRLAAATANLNKSIMVPCILQISD
jgi:hypothetical protein